MFSHKSVFTIAKKEGMSVEDLILELIDFGVDEDVDDDGDELTIYGEFQSFNLIQKYLEENEYEIKSSEFTRIPTDEKELNAEQRATIEKMVERLEDDEDVQNVYTNLKPAEDEE
jgi:transcriptional/translational regulatory protein YebC/TACO1